MNRKPFKPQPGVGYQNSGGGSFDCIGEQDGNVIMRNRASGWTFFAHGCGIYEDGTIDWNYSTGGYFDHAVRQQDAPDGYSVFENAVQTYGKAAQVDMMIEEMAELTKELLNERRGRCHNIAEEMADVQIMILQMEIIFRNAADVEKYFREKVARLDKRLRGGKGGSEEWKNKNVTR